MHAPRAIQSSGRRTKQGVPALGVELTSDAMVRDSPLPPSHARVRNRGPSGVRPWKAPRAWPSPYSKSFPCTPGPPGGAGSGWKLIERATGRVGLRERAQLGGQKRSGSAPISSVSWAAAARWPGGKMAKGGVRIVGADGRGRSPSRGKETGAAGPRRKCLRVVVIELLLGAGDEGRRGHEGDEHLGDRRVLIERLAAEARM